MDFNILLFTAIVRLKHLHPHSNVSSLFNHILVHDLIYIRFVISYPTFIFISSSMALRAIAEFIEELTKLFEKFERLFEKAKQTFSCNDGNNIKVAMGDAMTELWSKWTSKKRLSQEMTNDGRPQFVSEDDEFFNVNNEAINQVMRRLEMGNQEKDASERSKGKKVLGADIEPPPFSLRLNNSQPSQLSPNIANSKGLETMTTPEQEQLEQDMFDYFVAQPNIGIRLEENKREQRILDKLSSIFRSPFLANNEKLVKNFSKLQTTIADYAFEDGNKEDVLYNDNCISINRSDMLTLSNNYVINNVIDAYVRPLNDKNRKRSTTGPNRIFFKTNAFMLLCTEKGKGDKAKRLNDFIETLTNEMKEIFVKTID